MNYERVVQKTKENGGYTHSVGGRYVVAVEGHEKIVPLKDFTPETVEAFHKEVGDEFGTWINKGNVYLDKVQCFYGKDTAIDVAKERNQFALYDLLEQKEIETI